MVVNDDAFCQDETRCSEVHREQARSYKGRAVPRSQVKKSMVTPIFAILISG